MMDGTMCRVPKARNVTKTTVLLIGAWLSLSAVAPAEEKTVVIPYRPGPRLTGAIYIPEVIDPAAVGSGSFVLDEWDNFRRPEVDFSPLYGVREASQITGIKLTYSGYSPLVPGHA